MMKLSDSAILRGAQIRRVNLLAVSVSASIGYALAARGAWLAGGAVLVVLAAAITIRTGAGR